MYIEKYDSNAARIDKFNSLIPKMVWRGSDWRYLSEYESIGSGSGIDFLRELGLCHASKSEIIDSVLHSQVGDTVKKRVPPKIVCCRPWLAYPESFTHKIHGQKQTQAPQSSCIDDKFHIFTSNEMDACGYSQYKYLADFGGGGGTSWRVYTLVSRHAWRSVSSRNANAGFFYDDIQPWVHYIPLDADLPNLEERVKWAKENPDECASISKRATQFAEKMMSADGLIEHTKKTFVEHFGKFIDAYEIRPADEHISTAVLTTKYSNDALENVKYAPTEPAYLGNAEQGD